MLLPPGGPQCEWVGEADWCETGTFPFPGSNSTPYQARALRALGLLLADRTPTVGGGKTF